jgi:hypothetical protein
MEYPKSVLDLPDDVFEEILNKLRKPSERVSFGKVCRKFDRLRLKYTIKDYSFALRDDHAVYADTTKHMELYDIESFLTNINSFSHLQIYFDACEAYSHSFVWVKAIKRTRKPVGKLSLGTIGYGCHINISLMPAVKILELKNPFVIIFDMDEEQCRMLETITITDSHWGQFAANLFRDSERLFEILGQRHLHLTKLTIDGEFVTNELNNIQSVMPDVWSTLQRLPAIEEITLPILCIGHLTDPLLFNGFNANLPSSLKVLHLSFKLCGYSMSAHDLPVFFEHALKALIPQTIASNTLTVVVGIQYLMHIQLRNYNWNQLFPKIPDLNLHFVISYVSPY